MGDVKRNDGWRNLLAGLGGKMDKRRRTEPEPYVRRDDSSLAGAYMSDGFARNVVDMPADDMTREWLEVGDDPDGKVSEALRAVDAESKLNEALKWARLFGGSFVVLGAMDGRTLEKPLNLPSLRSLDWLYVGDRTQVSLGQCQVNRDPMSKDFGKVEVYDITFRHSAGSGAADVPRKVHASRVLTFYGEPAPISGQVNLDSEVRHWGLSSLQATWDHLMDYGGVSGSVANLMYELIVNVYLVDGLAEMLAAGNEAQVIQRMEVISMTKSMINGVLLDSREKLERNTASLAGVPEVLDRYMIALSGAARIPVTRLFGRSPAGLNATGESDLSTYYDTVRAKQKNELLKPAQYLVDVAAASLKMAGPHQVTFNPLKQMTPAEVASLNKDRATTLKTVVDALAPLVESQVITQDELLAVVRGMASAHPELAPLAEAEGA